MENEYGITVANKYALFLNEDEDSLGILTIHQDKTTKKADKTKKNAGKEKDGKLASNKQSVTSIASQDKKVDQFSSPTVNNEPIQKSGGSPVQAATQPQESRLEPAKVTRTQRERPKPRSNVNRESNDQHGDENKNVEPIHDNRPPRIRARDGAGSEGYQRRERRGGGFGENRQFRPDTEGNAGENTDRQNSIGFFERRERRPPRNGFSEQTAVADGETSEQTGRQGDRVDRDGFGGRGNPRRGGFVFRGRGRPDRNQFSERSDSERVGTGFDENQSRQEERIVRDGFNDNDGGKFMERPERDGFGGPRRDYRGRRGGFGRGRGGYDRPPRREYQQRFGDRRQRPQEGDGEAPSHDQKTESADGEPKVQQEKLQEVAAGVSWAEQIDAADQEAKKDSLNAEDEAGDDLGEGDGEPKVMTLDEWKAREDNKRIKAEFNIRKPGEGYNTDPQWKKMFVLSKKERPEEHDEEEEQEEEEHHIKPKNVLPIEIHFADDSMRGGRGGGGGGRRGGMSGPRGRGGRSSGRWDSDEYGGEGRGSNQGGRGNYNENRTYVRGRGGSTGGRRERTPNFSDESDFPSLGSSAQP